MSRTKSAGKRRWVRDKKGYSHLEIVKRGIIDFEEVKSEMTKRKIELRGGDADESPECYKNLDDVLGFYKKAIRILFRLHPIGVAMAGPEISDPYKD
jgi:tRNA-splicing ligase RtcB